MAGLHIKYASKQSLTKRRVTKKNRNLKKQNIHAKKKL